MAFCNRAAFRESLSEGLCKFGMPSLWKVKQIRRNAGLAETQLASHMDSLVILKMYRERV